MSTKTMKTLTIDDTTYEIVDEQARADIEKLKNGNVDINFDTTLTQEGYAADAKAVGDRFTTLETQIPSIDGLATEKYVDNAISNIDFVVEETDPTVPNWAKQPTKPVYTASEVGADSSGTASSIVSTHNSSTSAHNDIRDLIVGLTTRLNTLADSDDSTLDQLSEIVAYIKSNKSLIEEVTNKKVNVADIIDNLTTNNLKKPLSAAQGVVLKGLIDAITVPTKLSELTDDATHRLVTDTEKSTWNAKADKSNIPSKVSELTNDAGYITIDDINADENGAADTALINAKSYTDEKVNTVTTNLSTHINDKSNPHGVTKSQVGLGNVDNTSDANKPVSTAQATAIADAKKAGTDAQVDIDEHINDKSNPHDVTTSQIGAVPTSRKVNGKDLSTDINLKASDVGALPDTTVIPKEYTHPTTHPASMITGLATVATSGKYSDLSDKPTIPTVPTALKNPNALTVNGTTYDGSSAVDMTSVINALIDTKLGVIENGSY